MLKAAPNDYRLNPGGSGTVYDEEEIVEYVRQRNSGMDPRPYEVRRAFEKFREHAIATIEGDVCCASCGSYDLGKHAKVLEEDNFMVKGYAFYHIQGIESRHHDEFLFDDVPIYYGAIEESDEATKALGNQLVSILEESGVPTDWDGNPDRAIIMFPQDR